MFSSSNRTSAKDHSDGEGYGKTNSILLFGTTDATIVFAARLDTLFFCVWRCRDTTGVRAGQMCIVVVYIPGL